MRYRLSHPVWAGAPSDWWDVLSEVGIRIYVISGAFNVLYDYLHKLFIFCLSTSHMRAHTQKTLVDVETSVSRLGANDDQSDDLCRRFVIFAHS